MKKIKTEDILAMFLLLGVLFLFASFLFEGASRALTMLALWFTIIGVGVVLLLKYCDEKRIVNKGIRTITVLVICAAMTCGIVSTANAVVDAGNLENCAALNAANLTLEVSQTNTTSGSTIKSSSSNGTDTITVVAKGTYSNCSGTADVVTVKATNKTASEITMKVTLTNASANHSGTAITTGDTITLTQNQYVEFSVTSNKPSGESSLGDVTGQIVISEVSVKAADIITTTNFEIRPGGSYTIDGVAITANCSKEKSSAESYTLVATASDGYEFVAWYTQNGQYSTSATVSYQAGAGITGTVYPVFMKSGSALFYIKDASPKTTYYFFNDAIDAAVASTSGTIVVSKSGSIYHSDGTTTTFTIPKGVTLLLPYSDSDLSIKTGEETNNDFKHANVAFADADVKTRALLNPETDVLYTLTIPADTTVKIADGTSSSYGRIIVGGTIVGAEGSASTTFEGTNYGAHSNLVVDGKLELGSYSVLSAVGYVLGSGSIETTATCTAAEIYQPMVFADWRGAKTSALFVESEANGQIPSQSGESAVSPFIQWATFNIRPTVKVTYGNFMYMYASVYDGSAYCTLAPLVGTSTGLIQLSNGAALTNEYEAINWGIDQGFPGRNKVTISGGASLGTLELKATISFIKTYNLSFSSSEFVLPVCYAYGIVLKNGDYYVDNSMALLPGASITVNEYATLHIGESKSIRFMVFDGLNHRWKQKSATSQYIDYVENKKYNHESYPTTGELQTAGLSADAELIIDGTLVIGQNANMGGVIQTTGTGTVNATAGTSGSTTGTSVQIGVLGTNSVLASDFAGAGSSIHEMNAKLVSSATGERIDLVRGKSYTGTAYETVQEGYSFKYYVDSTSTTSVTLIGDAVAGSGETAVATKSAHPLNETVYGAWACEVHTDEDTDHVCDVCGYVTKCADGEDEDTLCDTCGANLCTHEGAVKTDEIPATCTADGIAAYWCCSACGKSFSDADCTTEIIDLDAWKTGDGKLATSAHSYESVVTAPTCTEGGYTTYTCSACGDSYTADEVAALGHSYNSVVTAPTCTEVGYTTYTCTVCGDSYTADEVAAQGHSYSSEVTAPTCTEVGYTTYTCTVCGDSYEADEVAALGHNHRSSVDKDTYMITYTCVCGDSYSEPCIVLSSMECYYRDEVVLRLKFTVNDTSLLEVLTFTMSMEGRFGSKTATYTASEMEPDSEGRYVVDLGVASGEMTRDIITSVTDADGNPIIFYTNGGTKIGSTYTTSVQNYVKGVLTSSLSDANKKAAAALAAYGGYAQLHFGYETGNLAYTLEGLELPDLSTITSESLADYSHVKTGAVTGITIKSYETYLDSNLFMRFRFELDAGAVIGNYTFTLTDASGNQHALEPVYEESSGRYYVDTTGIPAAHLDNAYTVTVTDGSAEMSIQASVLSWIRAVLQQSQNDAQKNMVKALYYYSQACSNLFGQ